MHVMYLFPWGIEIERRRSNTAEHQNDITLKQIIGNKYILIKKLRKAKVHSLFKRFTLFFILQYTHLKLWRLPHSEVTAVASRRLWLLPYSGFSQIVASTFQWLLP